MFDKKLCDSTGWLITASLWDHIKSRSSLCLDAYGLSDLKVIVVYMRSLTSMLSYDGREKFEFDSPTAAWHTVVRCWEIAPAYARIIQVILDFHNVLRKANEVGAQNFQSSSSDMDI